MFLHVRIKVRDLERSIAFYTEYFGFRLRKRKTTQRGSQLAFLHQEGTPTEIELAYLPWDPDFKLDEDILHVAFSVPDMQTALERFRAGGVPVTEEGEHISFIADPDGYEVELISD